MGDRAQVKFITKEKAIYFYTHWDGSKLEKTVIDALKRGIERLEDPDYLARIIFCEMVKGNEMSVTGAGIGLSEYEKIVTVDCDKQEMTFFDGSVKPLKELADKDYEHPVEEGDD